MGNHNGSSFFLKFFMVLLGNVKNYTQFYIHEYEKRKNRKSQKLLDFF